MLSELTQQRTHGALHGTGAGEDVVNLPHSSLCDAML